MRVGPLALVVPGDLDRATGGNVWDRRVHDALAAAGHDVHLLPVDGSWPEPGPADLDRLAAVLAARPDGSPVLVDGLLACGAPEAVLPSVGRLRVGVVVHLPLARETGRPAVLAARLAETERRVLEAVDVVVVTSPWTAGPGLAGVRLRRAAVVAEPGTDPRPALRPRTASDGGHLLLLGSLTPRKGARLLVEALAVLDRRRASTAAAPPWRLRLVGEQPDPAEVAALRADVTAAGLDPVVGLLGPRTGPALEEQWRWADLLVVPSVVETYGMVVTEALARGLPVLASTGGALPATLGTTADGPPGLLVPPGAPGPLAEALGRWLDDADLRTALAVRARERAGHLPGWDATARAVASDMRLPRTPAPTGVHASTGRHG